MTRKFHPKSESNPTCASAETYGIKMTYAYLLRDYALHVVGKPIPGSWPEKHHWHQWALEEARREHGWENVFCFMVEMTT